VLADHAKWGVTGLATITGFKEVDTLVTDAGLAEPTIDFLSSQVRDLVVVLTASEVGGVGVA
jgi:DeoR/GlpR family transcriptional regulator of sugar metabolism